MPKLINMLNAKFEVNTIRIPLLKYYIIHHIYVKSIGITNCFIANYLL